MCAALAGLCAGGWSCRRSPRPNTGDIIAPQNSPASAADGWQAGTCTRTTRVLAGHARAVLHPGGGPPAGRLHPVHRQRRRRLGIDPVGVLKDVRVDLPVGLSVNPQATPQCELATFKSNRCAARSPRSSAPAPSRSPSLGLTSPPVPASRSTTSSRATANRPLSASKRAGSEVYLKADVDWNGDYHEGFTIAVPEPPLGARIYKNRLVFNGDRRQRDLPDQPEHLPRPGPGAVRPHLLDLPAGRLGRGPGRELPQRLDRLRGGAAARRQTDRVRRASRSNRGSPWRRGPTGPTPRPAPTVDVDRSLRAGAADRQLEREDGAHHACRSAWASTRRPPPGLVFCNDAQLGKGTRERGRLPGRTRRSARSTVETPPLPRRLADRRRLPRQAAQPRPGLGRASTGSSSTPSRPATASRRG